MTAYEVIYTGNGNICIIDKLGQKYMIVLFCGLEYFSRITIFVIEWMCTINSINMSNGKLTFISPRFLFTCYRSVSLWNKLVWLLM